MPSTVSIVIPVYNASSYLNRCLDAIGQMAPRPLECIVVDDGSTDGSATIAQRPGITTIVSNARRGPAEARNTGAKTARGEILLFVDADVVVPSDALSRIIHRFEQEPDCDALIGSYDDQPASPDFVSQYRNLLHCFTHQGGRAEAGTFWTGCGAIRTSVFREHGGFSEADRPYLEDVELGLRLQCAGRKIRLDKGLLVKHLKKLSLAGTLKTDLLDRAIPWSLLILRFRSMPADLNLKWSQRFSVVSASAGTVAAAVGIMPYVPPEFRLGCAAVFLAATVLLIALNQNFYRFLARRKGVGFAARALAPHWLYFLCGALGFAIALVSHALRSPVSVAETEYPSAECDG